jgi:hypothetical protein
VRLLLLLLLLLRRMLRRVKELSCAWREHARDLRVQKALRCRGGEGGHRVGRVLRPHREAELRRLRRQLLQIGKLLHGQSLGPAGLETRRKRGGLQRLRLLCCRLHLR